MQTLESTAAVDLEPDNDLGPLAWVLDELRKSLESAVKSLRRFVRESETSRGVDLAALDASQLRVARQQLHQALGALEMVGLAQPARLLRAMETATQNFVLRPELCNDDAAAKIERASFALVEYLENVLAGKSVSPVALFPQYRDVQELVGAEKVHPADLWVPERRAADPSVPAAAQALAYAPAVRSRLDQAVLRIVKTGDPAAARDIHQIALGLAAGEANKAAATFWKVCAGFFEALGQGLLPADVYVKRLASRILLQYTTLARGDTSITERLLQDLLFFCAQAQPAAADVAPALAAVREAYGLARHAPVDYESRRFGRFDPAMLVQARKRIASATETWSALAGGDTHKLKAAADQFNLVCDSLQKLQPESGELARALMQAVESTARSGQPPAAPLAMEVATAVLYLQAAYEDLDPSDAQMAGRAARLAERLDRVRAGGESEPLETWMEELYSRVSDRQTMGSVVEELRATLGEVEKSLDQYFRDTQDKAALAGVPNQLAQMRGVLSVLGLDQASHAVMRMRDSVDRFLVDGSPDEAQRATTFEKLGNSLGALGFLVDMLNYQRALAKKLFVYDEEQGELKVLMGRKAPAPTTDMAPDVVAAPLAAAPAPVSAPAPAPSSSPAPAAFDTTITLPTPAAAPAPVAPAAPAPAAGAGEAGIEDEELRDIFLEEAREVVQTGLASIAALRDEASNLTEQTTLRRAFHTLKGSSRMVGLSEFGEAAWSMEQLFNAWLAEQKPVDAPLLALAQDALQAQGRWVEDLAANAAAGWSAAPFRASADAMRLERRSLPLAVPGTAAPADAGAPSAAPAADALAAIDQFPTPEIDEQDRLGFESTQIIPDSVEPRAVESASTPATLDIGELDFGSAPAPAAPHDVPTDPAAAAALPAVEWDLDLSLDGAQVEVIEAAELPPEAPLDAKESFGLAPADVGDVVEVADAADVTDPEATQAFTVSDAPAGPAAALPVLEEAVSAFAALDAQLASPVPAVVEEAEAQPLAAPEPSAESEAGPPGEAAEEPAPAAEEPVVDQPAIAEPVVEEPAAVPAAVEAAEPERDDMVKVIGSLRIGIPLYNVYLNEADEWSRRLLTEATEWSLELHQPVPDSTVALAHSLAGSSATVGFQALSDMARMFEHALQHVQLQPRGTPEQAKAFINAAEDVRRLLHQFAAGFLKEPDPGVVQGLREVLESEAVTLTPEETEEALEAALQPVEPPPEVVVPHGPISEPARTVVAEDNAAPADTGLDDDIDVIDVIDPDLFPIFEEEALELLPQLGGALRQWHARPENESARGEVLRALHTLKGSARLAGALRLGELAHRMESAIEHLDTHAPSPSLLEPLVVRFDALQENFDNLRAVDAQAQSQPEATGNVLPLPELTDAALAQASAPAAAPAQAAAPAVRAPIRVPVTQVLAPLRQASNQSVRVRSQLLDRLVNQAGEVMISRSRLEEHVGQLRGSLAELTGNLDRLRHQLRDIELQAETQMQSRLALARDSAAGFDPLEFDRFTRVQELTRMMAESVNDVATVQRNLQRSVEGAEDDLLAQGRQSRELQRDLLRIRMVEFEGISERLYAVVRQAAKDAGKQVKLDITGGAIEMDRGVLDRMTPAFEHLLRNAVAHGIEDPAVRGAAGKSAAGTITIGLHHEGNDVSVEFRDDGAGLNLQRIREKAVAQGLAPAGTEISDAEAANLIFMPGFSTASSVTELAGRGIGMDVVRSEVTALGGRIETSSVPGQGTAFKMVLPLTTAVTQVVMLRAGELSIGVPASIVEIVRRTPMADLEEAYRSGVFHYGGEDIPFYWAGALLQSSARSTEPAAKACPVILFRSAAQRLAVHVDEVLGNQEVVVKNLGPQLSRLPGLAGMSVLASGAVVLVYNPVALATIYGEQARQRSQSAAPAVTATVADVPAQPVAPAAVPNQIPLVLVVDDSITVRRVTQRLLHREGYRVALAADGLQALERLQEELPAVVLSDIEMPRMDGFDLARNIRGDAQMKDLPIIMITSRIAEKHREHAKELGVDHYLGKPYSEEELLSLVRRYTSAQVAAE